MTTCIPHRHGGADDVAVTVHHWCNVLHARGVETIDLETMVGRTLMLDEGIVTHPHEPDMTLDPVDLVEQLEALATPRAATLLQTLARIAAGPLAKFAAHAVERLEAERISIEDRFADVGQARALRAWATPDANQPEGVLIEFDYAGERPHAFAVSFENDDPPSELEIVLMYSPQEGHAQWPDLVPVPLSTAARLIDEAIVVADQFDLHGVRPHGALLWSRIRALDPTPRE
jgi:hypothetical protein